LVKLVETDGYRVQHIVVDYIIQPASGQHNVVDISDVYEKVHKGKRTGSGGGEMSPREQLKKRSSGEVTIWMEKVSLIELKYVETQKKDTALDTALNADDSTETSQNNNVKGNLLAAHHLTKGDALRRKCAGDFCQYENHEEGGAVSMDIALGLGLSDNNNNGSSSSGGGGGGGGNVVNKVVTYRSIESARHDGCEMISKVRDMVKESIGTLRSLENDEVEMELIGCFQDRGWRPNVARWWLRNKANLPLRAQPLNSKQIGLIDE
jgi:hypothetical protein